MNVYTRILIRAIKTRLQTEKLEDILQDYPKLIGDELQEVLTELEVD